MQEEDSRQVNTPVILVCMQKRQANITHEQIRTKFQQFGDVLRLLIFEKSSVLKVFVEFASVKEAREAQRLANNTFFSSEIRMVVYRSNLDTVVFPESNHLGRDYTKQYRKVSSKSTGSKSSLNSTDDDQPISLSEDDIKFHETMHKFSEVFHQKTSEFNQMHSMLQNQLREICNPENQELIVQQNFATSHQEFLKLLHQNQANNCKLIESYMTYFQSQVQRVQTDILQRAPKESRVIVAKNVDDQLMDLKMLYNIFSIYGNIEKMVFLKDKSVLLVQYYLQKCSNQCIQKLNQVKILGQTIELSYSRKQLIEDSQEFSHLSEFEKFIFEETFIGDEQMNRYKTKNSFIAAPPNDTVYLMNLSDELLNLDALRPLFQDFGAILDHQYLIDPKSKHCCSIRLSSTEIATLFIAKNHGVELAGRKIIITYSKKSLQTPAE